MIKRGKPTVLLISTNFVETAKTLANAAGLAQLPHVVFPAEIDTLPEEEIRAWVDTRAAEITGTLIDPFQRGEAALHAQVLHARAQRV